MLSRFENKKVDREWLNTNFPCMMACPAGTNAGRYVSLIAEGRFEEAYHCARDPNPLASVCGRVCAHPCETACRRGEIDSPISIRALKRFLTERYGPESRHPLKTQRTNAPKLPYRIAIVGSGAAGIAAAVCAARTGYTTLLLDQNSSAGGTGGFSGLTTLCGLFDDEGKFLNAGFTREFTEAIAEAAPVQMGKVWVLPYHPEKFRAAAEKFFAAEPKLQTRWNTPLENVVLENNRIVCLNGIAVGAVIDCSGTAEVARTIGADCLATDATTQAPAVIFPLQNVTRKIDSPADAARILLPLARAGFPSLNFHASLEPNTLTVKFTGRVEQARDVIQFLRVNISGFENCSAPLTSFTEAQRAGRMIIGQYTLTGADVLAGKKFPDAVARCAWPIEQWNADGVVRYNYLPAGTHYEIPARSLRAAKIENFFMAGKTISADAAAIASARVMGACLVTGAAAGNLAANYLESAHAK